jgi:hypothetical protein
MAISNRLIDDGSGNQSLEFVQYGLLLRPGRRHVRFVVVNGRTPVRQSFCALCCKQISEGGYLRDIRTRLCYCEAECYALKCANAMMLPQDQAKAS